MGLPLAPYPPFTQFSVSGPIFSVFVAKSVLTMAIHPKRRIAIDLAPFRVAVPTQISRVEFGAHRKRQPKFYGAAVLLHTPGAIGRIECDACSVHVVLARERDDLRGHGVIFVVLMGSRERTSASFG